MAKLITSIKKDTKYTMGGLVGIIALRTFLADGVTPAFTLTKVEGKVTLVTLHADAQTPVFIESEDEKANFAAPLTVGAAGKYIAQTLGFTLGGMTEEKNQALEDIDLVKHSYLVRTRGGKNFLLGEKNGLASTQNNAGVAAGMGDLDGYDIIVSGAELSRPVQVEDAAWAALGVVINTAEAAAAGGGA